MEFIIHRFDSVVSTNNVAIKMAQDGFKDTIVIADTQTGGKGRRGNLWEDNCGEALLMSLISSAEAYNREDIYKFSFISSLAVHNILKSYGFHSEIKWPNDVLIDNKKVCGILNEITHYNNEQRVIIGIGINIYNKTFSDEIKDKATSLYLVDSNIKVDFEDLAKKISEEIYRLKELDFPSVIFEWKKYMWCPKDYVNIVLGEDKKEILTCKFITVTDNGQLVVETIDKNIRKITSAEVCF